MKLCLYIVHLSYAHVCMHNYMCVHVRQSVSVTQGFIFSVSTDGALREHSYCKPAKSATKSVHISPPLSKQGSTMLSVCTETVEDITASLVSVTNNKCIQEQTANTQMTTQKITQKKKERKHVRPKSKVSLLINEKVVAKGITLSGDVLHGHTLPSGFTKVMIEQVFDPQAKLQVECYLDDDEQCLQQNMITAWKNEYIQV